MRAPAPICLGSLLGEEYSPPFRRLQLHSITTPLVAECCLAALMKRAPGEQNFPPQLTKTLRNVGSLRLHLMVRSF